jgi:two-component system, cell cycle sensor histidine kinase and response regulator CckA
MTASAATRPVAPPTRPVVLLVEDDDPVRELIGRALRANGFEVVAAASGEEALDLELAGGVDLLLSDVLLPNRNGFEVANQIRARSPHIPVVFMSGYYEQAVAEAAQFDISSTILQKPFAVADLLEHLRAAYAARRLSPSSSRL